ncbi:putative isopenicillin-N epimerase [Rosa chinensis]|uniref:Putative isopenicillin-N epimerase n=1 Tax=Rosa chinensis TaxID=74649 RepID=A0A2P6S8R7_ROSCH|nr:putative isopenicillin-N epimerase [Rosa chinensis]
MASSPDHNHTLNGDSNTHASKKPKLSFITPSEIAAEFSHHDPTIARINNGSFGSCPDSVLQAQRRWQLKYLSQPDHFYFNHLQAGILHSRTLIKDLINADHVNEVSIVDNATTAAAIVLQQAAWGFSESKFEQGDAVAYFTRAGGHVIKVPLPFPLNSNDEIVTDFKKALEKGKANGRRVRLAVIDHITSMPCVVIPVKELVKICREEGVDQVFVDAAHSIGCTEVDMKEIGANYYTSNLHKWFFCPPLIAFLYCRKSPKGVELHHPVVSHEYGNGLAIESAWIGTRDYSPQLVVSVISIL